MLTVIRQGDSVEVLYEGQWYRGTIVGKCKLRGGRKGYAVLLEIGKYTAVAESDVRVENG